MCQKRLEDIEKYYFTCFVTGMEFSFPKTEVSLNQSKKGTNWTSVVDLTRGWEQLYNEELFKL